MLGWSFWRRLTSRGQNGGTPFLIPWSAVSPKMTTPALPMTPLFYCRILFYSKNVDVCKKLELNPLRFDRDVRGLSLKKTFSKRRRKSVLDTKFVLALEPRVLNLEGSSFEIIVTNVSAVSFLLLWNISLRRLNSHRNNIQKKHIQMNFSKIDHHN